MTRFARAQFALGILASYDAVGTYSLLLESELVLHLDELESRARELLLGRAIGLIDCLMRLGFNNKEIAHSTGIHESVVSRVHNNDVDLQIGLATLREALDKLETFMPDARSSRVHNALKHEAVQVAVLDLSASGVDTDEVAPAITQAVLDNLVNFLCDRRDNARVELPSGVSGALVRVGPPSSDVFVFQVDGGDDESRLQVLIHELDHLIERLKSRLKATRTERRRSTKRTAAF